MLVVFESARMFTFPCSEVREILPVSVFRLLLRILRSSFEVIVRLLVADRFDCFWVDVVVAVVFSVTLEFELAETLPRL